jgi:hypothetical protein
MKKIFTLISSTLLLGSTSFGQYDPISFMAVDVQDTTGVPQFDYQVLLTVNTAAEVSAGRMAADGRDIRFSDSICGSTFFNYWIESGMNTSTTSIWVNVPSIPANGTTSLYLLSGDSTVAATSDFNAVFPNAIVTGGSNISLNNFNNVGWLQVDAGDTLFLLSGIVLDITARKAIIDGVVYGVGRGHQALAGLNQGVGVGGGTAGSSSGASGGSYGGVGGTGGYDSGDPINAAPPVYGTYNGFDIDQGSSGGSASSAMGGNGGGGFQVQAEWISASGTINMNGGGAFQPGGGQGGGGGAAGGIFLIGREVDFSGIMTANGGIGSTGTSTANDDGGGGGGGRIKVRYQDLFANTGTRSVDGGAPGIYGTAAAPTAGNAGTIHDSLVMFAGPVVTLGAQTNISNGSPVPTVANLPNETGDCSVTPSAPTASAGCGQIVTGTPNVSFPITNLGTTVVTWTYDDGAGNTSTQTQTIIVNGPDASVTQTGGTLTANLSGASYQWIDCATNQAIAGQTNQSFTPTVDGSYAVVVTDVCSDTSTCFAMTPSGLSEQAEISFSVYPNPAQTHVNVQWETSAISELEARLVDLQGRVAKSVRLNAETMEIAIHDLNSGIYVLEMHVDQVLVGSTRIVKQ